MAMQRIIRLKINKSKVYSGFTLAEVLVTLAIIGIVAALTIPTLIQNIQDQQYKTALKKVYATLSQATAQVADEHGGTLTGLPVVGWVDDDSLSLISYYYKYLGIAKKCFYTNTQGNCWHNNNSLYYLNGNPVDYGADWWTYVTIGAVLTDGTLVAFRDLSSNCNLQIAGGTPSDKCALVFVDVNGFKPPNTYGKDLYVFYILNNNTVIPRGTQGEDWLPAGECASSGNGLTCAASKILN